MSNAINRRTPSPSPPPPRIISALGHNQPLDKAAKSSSAGRHRQSSQLPEAINRPTPPSSPPPPPIITALQHNQPTHETAKSSSTADHHISPTQPTPAGYRQSSQLSNAINCSTEPPNPPPPTTKSYSGADHQSSPTQPTATRHRRRNPPSGHHSSATQQTAARRHADKPPHADTKSAQSRQMLLPRRSSSQIFKPTNRCTQLPNSPSRLITTRQLNQSPHAAADRHSIPTQSTAAQSHQGLRQGSSQLSSSTNLRVKQSIPPQPPINTALRTNQQWQPASVMAEEFGCAFFDLQKDYSNNAKLVDFVRSYYVSSLNTPEFCSTLQRSLTLKQPLDDPTIHNFFHDLSRLIVDQLMMMNKLKPMDDSMSKELDHFAFRKNMYVFIFSAAVLICTVATPIVTGIAYPKQRGAAAVAGSAVAASVSTIVFGELRNWLTSALNKRETVVRKYKEIITRMTTGARCGIKDLETIGTVASVLKSEIESLSDNGKKAAAVKRSCEELRRKVEDYNEEMKQHKQQVLEIIFKPLSLG